MSAALLAGIALLGGAGAVARLLLGSAVSRRLGRGLPYGTLAVNCAGAALLGLVTGLLSAGDALLLAGVGFLGSFTTFSTWMHESDRLGAEGRTRAALVYLAGSLLLGLALAWLGREAGAAL